MDLDADNPAFGLRAKVAFLSRPESYPSGTERVEVKETHMSYVFLTDTEAWKLKKPVRQDYLDFSTPEKRRQNCEEELRLNRRLAPDVYLAAVPLTVDQSGEFRLGGGAEAVDWLVRMRRLPADRFLDHMIAERTVRMAEAHHIGELLANFYGGAETVRMTASDYWTKLAAEILATQKELELPEYNLPLDQVRILSEQLLNVLEKHPDMFEERLLQGKVVEGHGDLRPEHICVERKPVIIDCLEFNRDLRILDSASELAFLALECERLGGETTGKVILDVCWTNMGDRVHPDLLAFHRMYHALTRAKIAVWHLKNSERGEREKWINKARQYIQLAASDGKAWEKR